MEQVTEEKIKQAVRHDRSFSVIETLKNVFIKYGREKPAKLFPKKKITHFNNGRVVKREIVYGYKKLIRAWK